MVKLNRLTDYRPGHKGIIQVVADSLEELNAAVEKLFKDFPPFPYQSSVTINEQTLTAEFTHWGAD